MEWHQRKPVMKVCPICGNNAGLSSSSLKLHLQKSHRKLSSGSVDSAMTMEIQKALTALKISRGGSVSPTQRSSHPLIDQQKLQIYRFCAFKYQQVRKLSVFGGALKTNRLSFCLYNEATIYHFQNFPNFLGNFGPIPI